MPKWNKTVERRSFRGLNSGGEELQGNKTVEERSFRGIKQWRRGGASGE